MIIGTAGHVDHGKTALIHALTGIGTDRLREERERGLTIEAGYAYPEGISDFELGFIDVPGHERFIHNMLSGVAGIDTMLLVVAADDGVMPQTREHMQILHLLGIGRGVVALTKCDLAERAQIERVRGEIEALLAGTPLAGADIFELSSHTGDGVAALRETLWQRARSSEAPAATGYFRLAVDRAFTRSGAGLVITGTVVAGEIAVGASVRLYPGLQRARVRGLRRQNREADRACRGDRLALNLAGPGVDRSTLGRGDWVFDEALPATPLQRVDIAFELLAEAPPLAHWSGVHVHLGASHVTGHIALLEGQQLAPGGRMLAQLVLDRPLHACCGDRLIVRDHGARHTLGGGVVLDIAPPRRGKRSAARLEWLESCRKAVRDRNAMTLDEPLAVALAQRDDGADVYLLASNFNRTPSELTRRFEALGARVISAGEERRAFSPQALARLEQRIIGVVADNHEREPATAGTERERLRRQTLPGLPGTLFRQLLTPLIEAGRLQQQGPFVALPGHQARLSADDEALWQRIEPLLTASPFEPPRVRDIATRESIDERRVRAVLTAAARLGRVYHVRRDHFFLAPVVYDMARLVGELEKAEGAARVASFRDRLGTGRKLALSILEFFDRIGFTRRVRDDHVIRRADMWD
ncbi:selenocysteine-specific translation elongation factor [Kushneria aurantia]|uniref:Selenocysteine-specific translation elongation factor n=1 Tax=Kushneria aurantia TaxID=504092 RepID=A0ABV6FYU8_9GAMM|nr:selenocysteine-specific translation elongation factor [Kushneria aurantia]